MTDASLRLEKIGRTALLTLNRPQRRNALDASLAQALLEGVETVRADSSLRSLVLTGAGGSFCSGADLADDDAHEDPAFFGRDLVLNHQRWHSALATLEMPVIAAVDGAAVGAGFSLALAADFVFMTPRARLLPSFVGIGLVPDLSLLYSLPRLVGLAKAKEILFSARPVAAQEALELGVAQAMLPEESLLEAGLAHGPQVVEAPPRALGLTKTLLNRAFETDREVMVQLEAAAQSLCGNSLYHAEAVRRFLGKQEPAYAGAVLPG